MISYFGYISILGVSWLPPIITGGARFRFLDSAARLFWLTIVFSFIADAVAVCVAWYGKNNAPIYNISTIVYLFLLCLYANKRLSVHITTNVGIYVGVASILVGIAGIFSLPSIGQTSIFFRVYMVMVIISIALAIMGFIVFQPVYVNIRKQPHFWLAATLVFFWSFLYLHLFLYDYFTYHYRSHKWLIDQSILMANVANNFAVAFIFLLFPKTKLP